jgi:hypothetical protein
VQGVNAWRSLLTGECFWRNRGPFSPPCKIFGTGVSTLEKLKDPKAAAKAGRPIPRLVRPVLSRGPIVPGLNWKSQVFEIARLWDARNEDPTRAQLALASPLRVGGPITHPGATARWNYGKTPLRLHLMQQVSFWLILSVLLPGELVSSNRSPVANPCEISGKGISTPEMDPKEAAQAGWPTPGLPGRF